MSTDPAKSPAVRASDADRDRVIDSLRTALGDGRLDPAEYEERVETALRARTFEALAPLTADLGPAPGSGTAASAVPVPARPSAEVVKIREKHGPVRRDGRWRLPQRMVLRTLWCSVTLDLTRAVITGPELVIDLRGRGNGVTLLLGPGMTVDADELSVRHGHLEIAEPPQDGAPEVLHVRLVGRNKHGSVVARWDAPDKQGEAGEAGAGSSSQGPA